MNEQEVFVWPHSGAKHCRSETVFLKSKYLNGFVVPTMKKFYSPITHNSMHTNSWGHWGISLHGADPLVMNVRF